MKGSGWKRKDQAENGRIRLKMKGSGWKRKDQAENERIRLKTKESGWKWKNQAENERIRLKIKGSGWKPGYERIAIGNYKQRVKDTENNNAFKMFSNKSYKPKCIVEWCWMGLSDFKDVQGEEGQWIQKKFWVEEFFKISSL